MPHPLFRSQPTLSAHSTTLSPILSSALSPLTVWMLCLFRSPRSGRLLVLATGLRLRDLSKPQVGIATVWYDGNPCNMHLLDLAAAVKTGVDAEGLVGLRFGTVGVSDGISMGTTGMRYSLPSRDLIADSIETVRPSPDEDGLPARARGCEGVRGRTTGCEDGLPARARLPKGLRGRTRGSEDGRGIARTDSGLTSPPRPAPDPHLRPTPHPAPRVASTVDDGGALVRRQRVAARM